MPPTNDQHITYNRTSKEPEQLYHDYARRTGVSDAALWLLYVIRLGGNNLTQASICADWHYPPQTINSALKRLESQGLVALAPATGSRRDKAVRLTTEGERVAAGAIVPLIEAERSALAAMAPRSAPPWSRSAGATSTS